MLSVMLFIALHFGTVRDVGVGTVAVFPPCMFTRTRSTKTTKNIHIDEDQNLVESSVFSLRMLEYLHVYTIRSPEGSMSSLLKLKTEEEYACSESVTG